MNVLHLIDHDGLGGAQTLVYSIINNSQHTYVFSLRHPNNRHLHQHHAFTSSGQTLIPFRLVSDIVNLIKKRKIHILEAHLSKSLVISLLIKKLYQPNLSVVFHEHGEILRQNRFFYRLILLATHPYIDAYIGVSKAVTHQLSKIHPQIALKSYTIYNFYPPQIKPGTKKYSSAPKFTIGFASRIISHKGWHSIAKAAAILDRKKIPIHFVIAGDGKDRQKLISTINHRHLPNIEYIGYKQNLEDFYRHIQALVIASASEASPLTFYEAQIRGIPVIASNVPALNEFITHEQNGLLFTFSNSRELAQQAERLFSDPTLYNSLSINANQIAKQYSFEKYLEHTQKLYAKLIQ